MFLRDIFRPARDALSCIEVREPDLMDAVVEARYTAYKQADVIKIASPDEFRDAWDESANVKHFACLQGRTVVGGLRIHVCDAPEETGPTSEVFVLPWHMLRPGRTLLDHTRFFCLASDPASSRLIRFELFRQSFRLGLQYPKAVALAPARQEHCAFYKRLLNFTLWRNERKWNAPLGVFHHLLWLVYEHQINEAARRYPREFGDILREFEGRSGREPLRGLP